MAAFLRKHAVTALVAVVASALTAGAPAIASAVADFARNAGKVDGRDAVGAGTPLAKRAGKLVATNDDGRLPNNIVATAPNAQRLDGVDSSGFLRKSGKAANAEKLDGRDSSVFLRSGGHFTVTTSDWKVSAPPNPDPLLLQESSAVGPYLSPEGVTEATVVVRPQLPASLLNAKVELRGVRVCRDVLAGDPQQASLRLSVAETSLSGSVVIASAIEEGGSGNGCTQALFGTPTLITGDRSVAAYASFTNLGTVRLAHTSFLLRAVPR